MRKIFLSLLASVGLAGSAYAADLPARTAPPAFVPPAPVAFSWTGFYAGLNAGYAWNESRWSPSGPFGAFSNDGDGFIGGGHVGYNWQINQFVVGLEGQINWLDMRSSTGCSFGGTCRTKQDWLGDINLRAGYAFDRALIYATGGVAFTDYSFSSPSPAPGLSYGAGSRTGWTIGVGLDYAITDNWIAGIQYKYYDFGSRSSASSPAFNTVSFREHENVIQARLSYKFGGPAAPVLAR
jgi:outer membrane immunogenic protein